MSDKPARRYGLSEVNSPRFETFDSMIAGLKEQMTKTERQILKVNWFLGLQVYIVQSNSVYGQHSVGELADRLGLSKSTIYDAKLFYERYSREELEMRLLQLDIPYRRLLAIARVDDEGQRLLLEQASSELKLSDEDLKTLIDKANSKDALPATMAGVADMLTSIHDTKVEPPEESEIPVVDMPEGGSDADSVDEDDDPEDYTEKELGKATSPTDEEQGLARELNLAADNVSLAISKLNAVSEELIAKLDHLSGLTGAKLGTAEKLLIGTNEEVQGAMRALYKLSKALADHNIRSKD